LELIKTKNGLKVYVDDAGSVSKKEFRNANAGQWEDVPGGFTYTYMMCTWDNDGKEEQYACR